MAIKKVTKSAIGIKFDYSIDAPRDRVFLPTNSYFYEKSSDQVWYKDIKSEYSNIWSYTGSEKNKLASIEPGAEVNVNADWNAISGDAFILNKPALLNDKFYTEDFTGAISFSILGTAHAFGRIPSITIYNAIGELILANLNIDYLTFDISVTFNKLQTGKIILT